MDRWALVTTTGSNFLGSRPDGTTHRLVPGLVAEVMYSLPGPKVGAFFDLDGTLVAGFTG